VVNMALTYFWPDYTEVIVLMVARGGIEPPTRGFSVLILLSSGYIYQ